MKNCNYNFPSQIGSALRRNLILTRPTNRKILSYFISSESREKPFPVSFPDSQRKFAQKERKKFFSPRQFSFVTLKKFFLSRRGEIIEIKNLTPFSPVIVRHQKHSIHLDKSGSWRKNFGIFLSRRRFSQFTWKFDSCLFIFPSKKTFRKHVKMSLKFLCFN